MSSETGSQVSLEASDAPSEVPPEDVDPSQEGTWTELRQHERIPYAAPIRITADGLNLHSSEQAIDLSLGGLFYQTDLPPKVGTMMEVQLGVDDDGEPICAKGKVVRTVPKLKELAVPPGAGIQFTELDERGRQFIEDAIRQYNELHPHGQIAMPEEPLGEGSEPPPVRSSGLARTPVDLSGTTRSKLLESLPNEELIDLCRDTSRFTARLRTRARELLERRGGEAG